MHIKTNRHNTALRHSCSFSPNNERANAAQWSKRAVCTIQIIHNCFLLLWKIPKEISRQSMLLNNYKAKFTISNITTYNFFTLGVNWPEIGCIKKVSIMFDICTYCLFILYSRMLKLWFQYHFQHLLPTQHAASYT